MDLSCKPEGSINEKQKQCNHGLQTLGMNTGRKRKHSNLSKQLMKKEMGYSSPYFRPPRKKTHYFEIHF